MHHCSLRLCQVLLAAMIGVAVSLAAQQPSRPAGGGLSERFKQLDRNGDGKVSAEEFPSPSFKQMDKNGDGFVTLEEVTAFYTGRRASSDTTKPVTVARPDFTVEDVALTVPGCAFSDPEFNDQQHRVTYWDYSEPGNIKVYVGELDPSTGLFKEPPGRDYLVAEHVSPFFKDGKWWAHNGPEWGCDRNGWTVFFTKEDAKSTRQLWRATPTGAHYEARQLTTLPGGACGGLYTQNANDTDTRLMFYAPDQDTVVWATATAPNVIHELTGFRGFKSISHWVPGTKWISYVRSVAGSASPQLVYLDTETGAVHQVSDESGEKFDAWGFRAPEFGGEVLMMGVIDRQQIAIYRDLARNGKPWTRIATLALPADAPHTHLYSVEPIAPETGVNGTSWFSLNAMAGGTGRNLGATGRTAKDGSIWVLSLGNDPSKRVVRRVDEGAVSGIQTTRYESESFVGTDEVFIYYERKSPETGRGELRRCRTGISKAKP